MTQYQKYTLNTCSWRQNLGLILYYCPLSDSDFLSRSLRFFLLVFLASRLSPSFPTEVSLSIPFSSLTSPWSPFAIWVTDLVCGSGDERLILFHGFLSIPVGSWLWQLQRDLNVYSALALLFQTIIQRESVWTPEGHNMSVSLLAVDMSRHMQREVLRHIVYSLLQLMVTVTKKRKNNSVFHFTQELKQTGKHISTCSYSAPTKLNQGFIP